MAVKNIDINNEFVPIFMTNDFVNFELLKNKASIVVKDSSKIKIKHDEKWRFLTLEVIKDEYDNLLKNTLEHLYINNREKNIYYFGKKGQLIPCGYYPVGYGFISNEDILDEYKKSLEEYSNDKVILNYDKRNKVCFINMKLNNNLINMNKLISFMELYGENPFQSIVLDCENDLDNDKQLIKEL